MHYCIFLYYISKQIHLYALLRLCKTMQDHVRLEIKKIFYILFFMYYFYFYRLFKNDVL